MCLNNPVCKPQPRSRTGFLRIQIRHADLLFVVSSISHSRLDDRRSWEEVRLASWARKRRLISKIISKWLGSISGTERYGPFLQRFRQQCMIGVGKCVGVISHALFPIHLVLIHEESHQFGHGNGRVGVIQSAAESLVDRVVSLP